MKILVIVSLFLLILLKGVYSQPYLDALKIQYYNFGNSNYKNSEDQLKSQEIWADAAAPIETNFGHFYTGISYNKIQLSSTNDTVSSIHLNGLSVPMGVIFPWKKEKWTTMFYVAPRISSDFKKITSKHLQLVNVCVNYYKANDKLTWAFGYFFNTEFYGPLVLPLLGVEWKISQKLQLYSLLPDNLYLEYKISDKLYTGFAYRICTVTYRLSEDKDSYYVTEGDPFWGHHQAKLYIDFYLAKNIALGVDLGHTFIRKYEKYHNDDIDNPITTDPLFRKFEDNLFVKFGLAYRFRYDKEEDK